MRKTIRTAQEEWGHSPQLLLFSVVWYALLAQSIMQNGFDPQLLIFAAAGAMPAIIGARKILGTLQARRLHKRCVESGVPRSGRIVDMSREYYTQTTVKGHKRTTAYYFLTVELQSLETGFPLRIQSEPYRMPLYRYLASPYVQVYRMDESGWKWVIDDFELKKSRKESDIPLESANVYLKDYSNQPAALRWIFTLVLLGELAVLVGSWLGVW